MLRKQFATTGSCLSVSEWLQLVRAEYLEIPGLQLTMPQIQRLWGLDDHQSGVVVEALTEARFLQRKPDGHYIRADMHGLSASSRIRTAGLRYA